MLTSTLRNGMKAYHTFACLPQGPSRRAKCCWETRTPRDMASLFHAQQGRPGRASNISEGVHHDLRSPTVNLATHHLALMMSLSELMRKPTVDRQYWVGQRLQRMHSTRKTPGESQDCQVCYQEACCCQETCCQGGG